MTNEVPNQIATISDLISKQKEADFKKMVQTTLPPRTFSGLVFVDFETQSLAENGPLELTPGLNSDAAENFFMCRVYSRDGHHSSQMNPIEANTLQEYKQAVNSSFLGVVRIDHEDLGSLTNGSTWRCTLDGKTAILDKIEQRTSFVFNSEKKAQLTNQKPTSAMKSHKEGSKFPQIEYKRPEGQRVEIRFKSNSLKTQAMQPQYRTFLDSFAIMLSESSFSNTFVQVNSLTRTPSSQAASMVNNRFGGGKSIEFFRSWYKRTYRGWSSPGTKSNELWNIISKSWSSPANLKAALVVKIKEQVSRGGSQISPHLKAGAIDINTNLQIYSDVKIMLEVCKSFTPYLVSFYNWEGVSDVDGGEKRRKESGVFDSNEHIHLNLTNAGTGGE